MISSVLLLSPKMFHSSISDILLKTNEHINVRCCETLAELTLTSDDIFKQSRLISFLNDLIVPSLILNKFKYGGFNSILDCHPILDTLLLASHSTMVRLSMASPCIE